MAKKDSVGLPDETIAGRIYLVRGVKVMLDEDLAEMYGVGTKRLNEQVKRNGERFPSDFMFVLTSRELVALRSQIATSNIGRGGRRYGVTAFTEHGVLMLSSVLRSEQAIQVNIHIMRVFTRMNKLLATNQEILRRLERIERKLADHDEGLIALFEQVKLLMEPPSSPRRRIGFRRGDDV